MLTFVELFARSLTAEVGQVRSHFSDQVLDGEQRLRTALLQRWLPYSLEPFASSPSAFATDGSQAIRHFSNGWSVIVAQAILVGPGIELPLVEVRLLHSHLGERVLQRYADLLMRHLELRVALDAIDQISGSVLCIDGSLGAMLAPILYTLTVAQPPLDGIDADSIDEPGRYATLATQVLAAYVDLMSACRERRIHLLSMAKATTSTVLASALAELDDGLPEDGGPFSSVKPSDGEMLYRWARGAGYTQPLLIGRRLFGASSPKDPVKVAQDSLRRQGEKQTQALSVMDQLPDLPAIITSYIRPRPGEDALRIDVPAWVAGLPDQIDAPSQWLPTEAGASTVQCLATAYGGPHVYNAALYVADRQVRLRRGLMDGPYLALLRRELGPELRYDRSTRRFL
jgi:hypothetical protein